MRSVLTLLAEGKLTLEPRFFKAGSQYGHIMEALSESEDKLLVALKADERKLFEAFSEAQTEMNRLSGIDRFVYGYRLGVLMTIEVFLGADAFIREEDDPDR
ncbi:MAG: DUF6809 family protein [Clostridiaceae bacterium]|nr:hypothetical protein [Eubacteriales bacterium]